MDDDACPGPGSGTSGDPFCKIQDGIDAAADGDVVLVSAGVYVENIDFLGKAIHVMSRSGPGGTTIDGGSPADPDFASVVTFASSEGPASILEGFTLTNGSGTFQSGWDQHFGGGIYCNGSSPTLVDNIITANSAGSIGGGVNLWSGATPTLRNNTICDNAAGSRGGGVYCFSTHGITNSIIWGNSAPSAPEIYGSPTVNYCDVKGGWAGTGNIDADPWFLDASNGDYHLAGDSPCIDASDPDYLPDPGATDIDGQPRPRLQKAGRAGPDRLRR